MDYKVYNHLMEFLPINGFDWLRDHLFRGGIAIVYVSRGLAVILGYKGFWIGPYDQLSMIICILPLYLLTI